MERIARAKAEGVRRKIEAAAPKLGELTKVAVPPVKPEELRETHFEFLAVRRNPDDRVLFERLLIGDRSVPFPAGDSTDRSRGVVTWPADPYFFVEENFERIAGDRLMAIFEQKPLQKEVYDVGTQKTFYLGKMLGRVKLPTPIQKDAGTMRIHVAPEDRADKDWNGVESLETELKASGHEQSDLSDEVTFAFTTLLPGKYKIKAVWDKRSPFTDREKAGAGDYESEWVGPVEIAAGGTATNVTLNCNVRVAGAASYYSADETAERHWREEGDLGLTSRTTWNGIKQDVIFSGPPSKWILRTNFVADGKVFGLARIAMFAWPAIPSHPSVLSFRKSKTPPKHVISPPLEIVYRAGSEFCAPQYLRILDEHGCSFEPGTIETNRRSAVASFGLFPRAAETFRLVGYGVAGTNDLLFDYTITNHVRAERKELKAQPFPFDVDVGGVKMHVTGISFFPPNPTIGPNYRGCMIQATFPGTPGGQEGWRAPTGMFFDAHGNHIDPADMCREEMAVRVFGRADHGPVMERESEPFELVIERPRPWTPKNP